MMPEFLSRDFVLTQEHVAYAVLADAPEQGLLPVMPRYQRQGSQWIKLERDTLKAWWETSPSGRIRHCPRRDCQLPFVRLDEIVTHYRPRSRWQELRSQQREVDCPERLYRAFQQVARVFDQHGVMDAQLGITGSLLIGAAGTDSDLDLVVYCHDTFEQARRVWVEAIQTGGLQALSPSQWGQAWRRRGTSLSLAEYRHHEERKGVTVMALGVKCDLGLVVPQAPPEPAVKLERRRIVARVIDDRHAFERPARWTLEGPISELVANTATFVGQVRRHEWIEAIGTVEQDASGKLRLVLGGSREAYEDRLVVCDRSAWSH